MGPFKGEAGREAGLRPAMKASRPDSVWIGKCAWGRNLPVTEEQSQIVDRFLRIYLICQSCYLQKPTPASI